MKKKLIALTSLALAAALLLSACVPPWASKIERAQATATAITENRQAEAIIAAAQVPAGTTDGAPAPAATQAAPAPETAPAAPVDDPQAPVAGTCLRDGQTVADNPNAVRTAMSYFGGTSEPCIFYGEVNFGLSKDNKGLTVLMVIPANWTLNMNGMLGYAFWARESAGAVDWSISDSTANLTRADGRNEATPLVVHVDNESEMAGLTELVRQVYPGFAYKLIPPALP